MLNVNLISILTSFKDLHDTFCNSWKPEESNPTPLILSTGIDVPNNFSKASAIWLNRHKTKFNKPDKNKLQELKSNYKAREVPAKPIIWNREWTECFI